MADNRVKPTMVSSSSHAVSRFRHDIENYWADTVRSEIKIMSSLDEPALFNLVPNFLEKLAELLQQGSDCSNATEGSTLAKEHGAERARRTQLDVAQVTAELQLLRNAIYKILREKAGISMEESSVIDSSIDKAICEAIAGYTYVERGFREKFLADVAHDMRNPLSNVMSAAEILIENPHDPNDVIDFCEKILINARKVDNLILNILDISLLRAGKLQLKCMETDMYQLIEHCIHARMDKPRFEGYPIVGYWSPGEMARVIDNLLDNAFKYGSEPVTIRISESHGIVQISVHNEGTPIPHDEQDRIFEAYYRTSAAHDSTSKGWGLGMPIIRSIVEAHGGTVGVESGPGRGTTFTVQVPKDSRSHQSKKAPV